MVLLGDVIGGIYGSMVWGEFLNTMARAVGGVIDGYIVLSFCLVSEPFEPGFGHRMAGQDVITCLRDLVVRIGYG